MPLPSPGTAFLRPRPREHRVHAFTSAAIASSVSEGRVTSGRSIWIASAGIVLPRMQFGIQIEPQFGYTFEDVRGIARDAEAAGFTGLWVSDHLFLNGEAERTNCLEAWTLLAALSQHTATL